LDKEGFITLDYQRPRADAVRARAHEFAKLMATRRTVRAFSTDSIERGVIEDLVRTAASAPSGANQQPWRFVVVTDAELKRRIREAAEEEERINYERRFPEAWKQRLEPLGTDWHKPFLEDAPYVIVVFRIDYTEHERAIPEAGSQLEREKHYYVMESVGIAVGVLIAAIHNAGLVTLTHTPNPMGFLTEILGRPKCERPYLVLPVGYPAEGVTVPNIHRKPFDEVAQFL
jgi:nitroreductase